MPPLVYHLGPDRLDDTELIEEGFEFEWIVYSYEQGSYDGSGYAVAYDSANDMLFYKNLSHCSCYGPMDGGWSAPSGALEVDTFLRTGADVIQYFPVPHDIEQFVRRLLVVTMTTEEPAALPAPKKIRKLLRSNVTDSQ